MKPTSRKEDMSQNGSLTVCYDVHGDIRVTVAACDAGGERITEVAMIEICNWGSGGKSPHTFKALQDLMKAMELDNVEDPSGRGVGV